MLRLDEKSRGSPLVVRGRGRCRPGGGARVAPGSRRSPEATGWRWAHSYLRVAGLVMLARVVRLTQGGSTRIRAPGTLFSMISADAFQRPDPRGLPGFAVIERLFGSAPPVQPLPRVCRDHRCSGELAGTTGTLGRSPMTSTTSGASRDAVGHRQLPRVSGTVGVGDARCRDHPPGAQRGCVTRRVGRAMSRSDALAAERVAELRLQIDYLASTVALLPASPRRAAALSAVRAIDRDITELLWHLGVDDSTSQPPHG
jgi:hypothetical protein